MMLISELEQSDQTGWFIIPTLNPDGLIEYEQRGVILNAYLEGRDNLNGVDLNRNYCTKNFRDIEFLKYGKIMQTSIG
jgi:murein tripeptide amidase MpaA